MTYSAEKKKTRVKDRHRELLELWMECDSLCQFMLMQAIHVPDATASEIRCFKFHWLKKSYPYIYISATIGWTVMLFASGIVMSMFNIPLWWIGWLVLAVSILYHILFHSDLMTSIQWYEDGKPIDY